MGFDELIDRTGTASSRWQGKGDTLALTTGDADFRIPAPIVSAIERRLREGVLGYDSVPERLTSLLQSWLGSRYGWSVEADDLVFIPGVVPGLNLACRALVPVSGKVICETPVYYPFLDAPGNAGREIATFAAFKHSARWRFDFDAFERLAEQEDTYLFLLCHPQNPLGRVMTGEELSRVADICAANNVLVCSDEIHCDLTFDHARHIPFATIDSVPASRCVTLMSPSKAFGMSGLGGAFAIITDGELRARFEDAATGVASGINALSIAAMLAAYGECEEYLAQELAYLEANRNFLLDAFGEMPGIEVATPEATYFLWLDFRQTGLNDPFNALLEAGVELSAGQRFGSEGFLRLNFASPRARLEEAVKRIRTVVG